MKHLLARFAAKRAHVLVVGVPGCWALRAEVEREVLSRGWRPAASPAEADVLAVCGAPGPELAQALDQVWNLMPGPRVRVDLTDVESVTSTMETVVATLVDTDHHRADALARPADPTASMDHEGMDHEGMDHEGMDHGDMDHGDMDHGDMDHGDMDHGDMDHGDMEMSPGGIPLAEGGEDRDGLEMDVLHVSLGPVLSQWPAGLVLRCTLQGDLIVAAEGRLLDQGEDPPHDIPGAPPSKSGTHRADSRGEGRLAAALECDQAAAMLALAGWEDAAAAARRARDTLVSQTDVAQVASALAALRRRVSRSRMLAWSLRDLGPLTAEHLQDRGLPQQLRGDAHDRLLSMLDRAEAQTTGPESGADQVETTRIAPAEVAQIVTGLELAAARLVVASLGVAPIAAQAQQSVTHG